MFFLAAISLIIITISWFICFLLFNDLSIKTKGRFKFKNILLIYPHPDDEIFTAGGLIKRLSDLGKSVNLLVLTRGEKGTPDAHFEESLKIIRTNEIEKVRKLLGINELLLKDLPDGGLDEKKDEIEKEVRKTIKMMKPDLIITFDQTGLYGHPDHIAVSETVTDLVVDELNNVKLWYASSPEKVLNIMNLPEHMAKDKDFKKRRKYPTHKVCLGLNGLVAKVRGVYQYQSQFESFPKAYPVSWVPLWFYLSFRVYEYFHEVN